MDEITRQQLDRFLARFETEAYKLAFVITQNRDDALEVVQDSMLKLVHKYSHKTAEEWRLLFFRILQNRLRDYQRRKSLRQLFHLSPNKSQDDPQSDALEQIKDQHSASPDSELHSANAIQQIQQALGRLPLRQQQVFLLRAWQEFSTSETAFTLSISEGSVKTHYKRAIEQLRAQLGEQYETL
jgi:RNA polymerase sigma-70 factor, ECF subfamily